MEGVSRPGWAPLGCQRAQRGCALPCGGSFPVCLGILIRRSRKGDLVSLSTTESSRKENSHHLTAVMRQILLIMCRLERSATRKDFKVLGFSRSAVTRHLEDLAGRKFIKRTSYGHYRTTEAGAEWASEARIDWAAGPGRIQYAGPTEARNHASEEAQDAQHRSSVPALSAHVKSFNY